MSTRITNKINEIIDRRIGRNNFKGKGHLEVIKKRKDFFSKLLSDLHDYQTLRTTILTEIKNQQGQYYNLSIEDPTLEQKVEVANPDETIKKLEVCIKECDRLEKRFNRDTINISVVGRARQGKSRLLQSISGLSNDIIPADDGGDCTGAKSIISNSDESTHAIVYFYSDIEVVNVVNDYLNALNSGFTIGSLSQIPSINIQSIEDSIVSGADKSSLLEHLKKYVYNYNSYAHLLGTTLPISRSSEIRRYTSQYLNNNEKTYEYLGVKEVKIFTRFNYADAGKIQLVDTIGLFDTALGLEQRMMETLANESDAAILLRLPNPMGDHVDEQDNKLYNDIEQHLGGETLNKWLFYILNVWDANKKSGDFMLEQLNKQLGKTLRTAFVKQVNCALQDEVEKEIVIPILETLSSNLLDIDNNLMSKANKLFNECYNSYDSLCNNISNVLSSNFKYSLKSGGLFDQLFTKELNLSRRLEELNSKYSNRHSECELIKTEILKVLKTLKKLCPQKDAILERLSRGDLNSHPSIVYENMADHTRADISDKFEDINRSVISQLQEDIKKQIIEVLKSNEGGKLGLVPTTTDDDLPSHVEWLDAFINQHLGEFPLLKAAFKSILEYRLNIEGLIEYRVNNCIELLEPESPYFEHHTFDGERDQIADEIHQAIFRTLPIIAENLVNNISDILYIPYNSFYARIKKIRERIIYSEDGYLELKELYRDKAPYIWHDRFAEVIGKQTALETLNKFFDTMSKNRSKGLFTIKIKTLE